MTARRSTIWACWGSGWNVRAGKPRAEAPQPDAARRLVARYTALMEKKFRRGKGVGELACDLGVTATHLTRCCRETCGRSAIDLLQDRRIFEARRLLSETDMPVGRIGAALALPRPPISPAPFSTCTGLSPTAFRRAS